VDSIGVLLAVVQWIASECDQSLVSGVHRRVISYGLVDIKIGVCLAVGYCRASEWDQRCMVIDNVNSHTSRKNVLLSEVKELVIYFYLQCIVVY
jgi:hypothetical protein